MQPRKEGWDAASLAERRRQSHTPSNGSPWTPDEANASSDEDHLHRQRKEDQHVASSSSSAKGGGDQIKGKGDDYEKGKGDDDGKGTGYNECTGDTFNKFSYTRAATERDEGQGLRRREGQGQPREGQGQRRDLHNALAIEPLSKRRRAPDGKVTQWERGVLHTPMMNLIGEYLCCFSELLEQSKVLEQSEVLALLMFLRCSRTTSGRKLDMSGVPVFRTLERFRERILDERFEEGMSSSEYWPTP